MEGAVKNGVPGIDADCGGACGCATCHVYVYTSSRACTGTRTEPEAEMLEFAENVAEKNSRLSCQIEVTDALDGLIVLADARKPALRGTRAMSTAPVQDLQHAALDRLRDPDRPNRPGAGQAVPRQRDVVEFRAAAQGGPGPLAESPPGRIGRSPSTTTSWRSTPTTTMFSSEPGITIVTLPDQANELPPADVHRHGPAQARRAAQDRQPGGVADQPDRSSSR